MFNNGFLASPCLNVRVALIVIRLHKDSLSIVTDKGNIPSVMLHGETLECAAINLAEKVTGIKSTITQGLTSLSDVCQLRTESDSREVVVYYAMLAANGFDNPPYKLSDFSTLTYKEKLSMIIEEIRLRRV